MLSLLSANATESFATTEDVLALKYILFLVFIGLSLMILITILLVVFLNFHAYRLIGKMQPVIQVILLFAGLALAEDQTRVPVNGMRKLMTFENNSVNDTLDFETILTNLYDPYLRISLNGSHLCNNSHLIIQTLDFKDYFYFPSKTDFTDIFLIVPSPVRFRTIMIQAPGSVISAYIEPASTLPMFIPFGPCFGHTPFTP